MSGWVVFYEVGFLSEENMLLFMDRTSCICLRWRCVCLWVLFPSSCSVCVSASAWRVICVWRGHFVHRCVRVACSACRQGRGEEKCGPCAVPRISLSDAVWNVVGFVSLTRTMVLFNRQLRGNKGTIKCLHRVYKFSTVIFNSTPCCNATVPISNVEFVVKICEFGMFR
jgi:hypothetical protein